MPCARDMAEVAQLLETRSSKKSLGPFLVQIVVDLGSISDRKESALGLGYLKLMFGAKKQQEKVSNHTLCRQFLASIGN